MKKQLLLQILLLASIILPAQSVPQYLLSEHFTNTNCVLCPPRNAVYYQTLENYPSQIHHITYHPPVPYIQDTFYRSNPAPQDARRQHYGVSATPKLFFQGEEVRQGSTLLPTSEITDALGKTAPIEVQVDEILNQGEMQVLVKIRTVSEAQLPGNDTTKLFVILVEDSVEYTAPNGEDGNYNIFRETLTSIKGEAFLIPSIGSTLPFSYTYTLDTTWQADQVHALAFVFHGSNLFLNSGTMEDLRLSSSSTSSSTGSDGTASVTASRGVPPYTYQWNDPDSQTTASAIGLGAGEYLVRVTDQAGTSIEELVEVQGVTSLVQPIDWQLIMGSREFNIQSKVARSFTYRLIGLDGKLFDKGKAESNQTISLDGIARGFYVLELKAGNEGIRRKIVLR